MITEYRNFLLNVGYQIITFIFPLITVPYISRVLGVENVGIFSFTNSIAYTFLLFGMLGLSNYGNREIAKVRDEREKTSECFSSIYSLQLLINAIAIFAYIFYTLFICKEYIVIAKIQTIYVASIFFDVSWLYFGLEKFKMTIMRNLIVKVLSLFLIFLFVKQRGDLWCYTLIMALSSLVSQLYLFLNLKTYVDFRQCKWRQVKRHIKGVCLLFIPVLAYCVYRVLDKTMIGAMASVTELGYFDNAEKLINIPITVNTALGTVMLPRMAYLISNSKNNVQSTILRSMKLALILACIMAGGLFLMSDELSIVLFGSEFIKSGTIIKALAITVVISAWASVIRTQYIIPNGFDSIYVKSTIGGAVINICCNLVFIRLYGALGACIGTVLAESYVMLYQSISCRKQLEMSKYFRIFLNTSTVCLFICGVTYLFTNSIENHILRLALRIVTMFILFCILERKYIVYEFFGKRQY